MDIDAAAITNAVSGVFFLLLAAWLARNPERSLRVGLACFIMTWGVQLTLYGASNLVHDDSASNALFQSSLVFSVLGSVTFLFFVATLPVGSHEARGARKAARYLFFISLLVAIVAGIVALATPESLSSVSAWGALSPFLLHGPKYLGLALGVLLAGQILASPSDEFSERQRQRLFVGLWLAIAGLTFWGLASVLQDWNGFVTLAAGQTNAVVYTVVLGVSALILAYAAYQWWRATRALGIVGVALGVAGWALVTLRFPSFVNDGPAWAQVVFAPGMARVIALWPLLTAAAGARQVVGLVRREEVVRPAPAESARMHVIVPIVLIPIFMGGAFASLLLALGGGLAQVSADTLAATLALAAGVSSVLRFMLADDAAPLREISNSVRSATVRAIGPPEPAEAPEVRHR